MTRTPRPGREKLMWEINAYATEAILRQAHDRGLDPIVSINSYSSLFPPPGPVIGPDTPTAPGKSAYAKTKGYADRAAGGCKTSAPIVITYPSSSGWPGTRPARRSSRRPRTATEKKHELNPGE